MFQHSKPDKAPTGTNVPPEPDLIALSVLGLELDEPGEGWVINLERRGIEVTFDDIGRRAISRSDAATLIGEQRELEVKKVEIAARQEQRFLEAEALRQAGLFRGVAWYEIGDGGPAPAIILQSAKDADPRRRSLTEDFLGGRDSVVFHPYDPSEDE
jgi:hypothetical protein